LVFPLGIIEVSTQENEVFYFISVPNTIIDLLVPETSTYLVGRNGAMGQTCFSTPQNAKKENQLKHKNQARSRLFIDS
jgi:hypothetical protein